MPYDPTGFVSHEDELHRSQTWKRYCRAATTANITISTALNNGDTLDGVTLATGDRVLVKDQSTGSQNGIYVVGVTPIRAFDMDQDGTTAVVGKEVVGAVIEVTEGTVNAGTFWRCTNTGTPILGTTALTFAQFATAGFANPMTTAADLIVGGTAGAATRLAKGSDGQVLTVDPTTHLLVWATPSSGFSNPMTTKGDLIVGDTGGSPIRKGVGSDGQVLTADAASTGGMKWATGGGSGVTVQYPALKPGSPTDDFTAASLAGGWSAHSNQGSFATGHCMTQGEDWIGSALEIQFSNQNGTLYQTHSDTDLDFTVGGIRWEGLSIAVGIPVMVGIAALNSSGTGVGVTIYNDGNCYSCAVTTYNYVSNNAQWTNQGSAGNSSSYGDWWLRLKRVSGTWTAYASRSGRVWDNTFATRADSIVVAQLHFGIIYNTATSYYGRLMADYFQVDV